MTRWMRRIAPLVLMLGLLAATAGSVAAATTVSADFSIGANPTSLSVSPGGNGTATISTAVISGAGTVSLAVSGVPAGATASISPTSVAAGGSATLTVSAGSSAAGTYTITITGSEGAATHSITVSLTVGAKVTPSSLGATTLGFIEGSARFTALPAAQQAWVTQQGAFVVQQLAQIQPTMTPAQKARFVRAYTFGVDALAAQGWLTQAQAQALIAAAQSL